MSTQYFCGIDTGGTFTDCVVIDRHGTITSAKRPSTPEDYSLGLFDALQACAERIGITLDALMRNTRHLFLGTTVGTNALVQMKGAKSGLITTRGHRDCLAIMRSAGRSAGLPIEKLLHVSRHEKPAPLIARDLVQEVSERTDWKGAEHLPLNEAEAEQAIRALVAEEVEAIGVCFLWSVVNPDHERRVGQMIEDLAPGVFVSCSHELIAKRGEYERTVGTAINCFIGPTMKQYIEKIEARSASHGYDRPLLVLQVTGGVVPSSQVARTPLYTISSGPAAGVTASRYLATALGYPNAIVTDMGGTSFETGIIYDGKPLTASETVVNQYVFSMPRLDIESIGSGGGSILWVDEVSGTLKVGPESAGADPGPACYGKGDRPTITDANLVLGYLNPDNFLGGTVPLDREKSVEALKPLARMMNMEVPQVAAGAVRIAEAKMAELIRQMSLQRGLDPRDFVIFAYGGAGPTHACEYARELGVRRIVVPLGTTSAAWSAFGTLCADILHVYERSDLLSQPFDLDHINGVFAELEADGRVQLATDGVAEERIEIQRFVDVKYRMQIHQLSVPVPAGEIDEAAMERIIERFEEIYESFYGKGSAYREAGVEIGLFKVNAIGRMIEPAIPELQPSEETPAAASRRVYWRAQGDFLDTPVYAGAALAPGHVIQGPAVVEYPETTVVLHPGATGSLDSSGSFMIELEDLDP